MIGPNGGLSPEYAEALQKARMQEQMMAQEMMISNQMKQQHDMAVAKAAYDKHVVEMLKNMTVQWENQANRSEAAAKKAADLMMQINGAQIARAKLEKAAEEEIAAKREQAIHEASIKRHEEMLAKLKNQSSLSTLRATNASSDLEKAFELFQNNSNRTGAAALAREVEALEQLGSLNQQPMMMPPTFGTPSSMPSVANGNLLQPPPSGGDMSTLPGVGVPGTSATTGLVPNPTNMVGAALDAVGIPPSVPGNDAAPTTPPAEGE